MISSLKTMTAAAALIFGVGLAAPGAVLAQNAQGPDQDRFHPSFSDQFNVSACTSDSHTAPATIVTFQSIPDWQRLASGNPQGFQSIFNNKAKTIIDKAWADVITAHSSSDFNSADDSFVQNVITELNEAAEEIEKETGISVIIRGGPSGPATPGCS